MSQQTENKEIVSQYNTRFEEGYESGIECGVSACIAGILDEEIIQAGGCNFPEEPLAPISQKKFYKTIYQITAEGDSFSLKPIGTLPSPIAYAASFTTENGIVVAGGNNEEGSSDKCYIIKKDSTGIIVCDTLPTLPVAIDNAGWVNDNTKLYIAGGNNNGTPSNTLYKLDLSDTESGWIELKSFPGNPRVQPTMATATDSLGNIRIYLWGGFAGKGEDREATLETNGMIYNPTTDSWEETNSPTDAEGNTVSLGGATAAQLPDGTIAAFGGVNKEVFIEALRNQQPDYLEHPIEWYKFNNLILIFNPTISEWTTACKTPFTARAGAISVAMPDGKIMIIGGELKPRIRTPKIAIFSPENK